MFGGDVQCTANRAILDTVCHPIERVCSRCGAGLVEYGVRCAPPRCSFSALPACSVAFRTAQGCRLHCAVAGHSLEEKALECASKGEVSQGCVEMCEV